MHSASNHSQFIQEKSLSVVQQEKPHINLEIRWKWLAQKLEMSAEMLDFIRTEPLNTSQLMQLIQKWDIQETDLRKALEKTSLWVYQQP